MNGGFEKIRSQAPPDLWPEIERRLSETGPRPPSRPGRAATTPSPHRTRVTNSQGGTAAIRAGIELQ